MCETMLQRLINALGDAADRYGEPPDPDPEAQDAETARPHGEPAESSCSTN